MSRLSPWFLISVALACDAKLSVTPQDTGTNDIFDPYEGSEVDADDTGAWPHDTGGECVLDTGSPDSGESDTGGSDSGGSDSGDPDTGGPVGPLTTCGDGELEEGEEYEPPPGPYTGIIVDDETCRWDFSGIRQLYCNGACSWSGPTGCDSTEANILCRLLTDNPESEAISWTDTTALAAPGFPCGVLGYGTHLDTDRVSVPVFYQDTSILDDHGPGGVIADPVCTDP